MPSKIAGRFDGPGRMEAKTKFNTRMSLGLCHQGHSAQLGELSFMHVLLSASQKATPVLPAERQVQM